MKRTVVEKTIMMILSVLISLMIWATAARAEEQDPDAPNVLIPTELMETVLEKHGPVPAEPTDVLLASRPYFDDAEDGIQSQKPASDPYRDRIVSAEESGWRYLPEIPLSEMEQLIIFEKFSGYDYPTILGICDKETDGTFDKNAVNHNTHDYGLFQINRKSWIGTCRKRYGIQDMSEMLDFEKNVDMAAFVYGDCVNSYGQTERAIAAYNMGPKAPASTAYSRDVLRRSEHWRSRIQEEVSKYELF